MRARRFASETEGKQPSAASRAGLFLIAGAVGALSAGAAVSLPSNVGSAGGLFERVPAQSWTTLLVVAVLVMAGVVYLLQIDTPEHGSPAGKYGLLAVLSLSTVAGVVGGAIHIGYQNDSYDPAIFVLDWLYPFVPAAAARFLTRRWDLSASKAAAIYVALPVIVVRALALAQAEGLGSALPRVLWVDGFGLVLGGLLLQGMAKSNGYKGYFNLGG